MMSDEEPLVPQKKLGKRFKLVRRLWSDHQSHVFEVFDRSKERALALRLLAWTDEQRAIARFKQSSASSPSCCSSWASISACPSR